MENLHNNSLSANSMKAYAKKAGLQERNFKTVVHILARYYSKGKVGETSLKMWQFTLSIKAILKLWIVVSENGNEHGKK